MKISSFFYSFKQGLKNIFRNRFFSLASVGTITACLFLFGVFFSIVVNFQHMIKTVESSVGVTVLFEPGVEEAKMLEIRELLLTREEVADVTYTSAEQAWEEYKQKVFPDDIDEGLLTNLDNDNPLADSANLAVYLNDTSRQADLITYIESMAEVRQVNASQIVADSFTSISRLIGYTSVGLIVILVGVAVFLISNTVTIGITVRREEIAIMKYLGATDFFVRAPFMVEGMLIGLIGSAIPVFGLRFLYVELVNFVSTRFGNLANILQFVSVNQIFNILIPVSLAIGLGIGFLGSYFTLRKHVRV